MFVETEISGFAAVQRSRALVATVRSIDDCVSAFEYCRKNGYSIALLGGGRSYGDQILNSAGVVLNLAALDRVVDWNPETGRLHIQAGARITEVLRLTLPYGWVLPSVPGSLAVTIGGAIANNVHGKDSARRGNFGCCVIELSLLTSDGECRRVTRDTDAEIFQAVIGGIGLFGIVVSAELQLVRIPSAAMEIETRISYSMETTVADLGVSEDRDYGQVWYDSFARGREVGRGFTKLAKFVGTGDHPDPDQLKKSLAIKTRIFGIFPARLAWRLARPLFMPPAMAAVNWLYYNKARIETWVKGATKNEAFHEFYFFHNNIPDFYSVYQPPGFIEIQALFPRHVCPGALSDLLALTNRAGLQSVLGGMKLHRADDFMISFQGGISITLAFPLSGCEPEKLHRGLRSIFEFIAENGGTVNLSKDERLPRDLFNVMYPKAARFWALKERLDPNRLFMSDMARRLFG